MRKPYCGCGREEVMRMRKMMGDRFNPMEMCKRMMDSVNTTATMVSFATPEVRALFEDWAIQVEGEVLAIVKTERRSRSR